MKTLEQLIAEAKNRASLDGRSSNRGRPRLGMPKDEATIVSSMRKKGVNSLMMIHTLLKENSMTRYENYGAFLNAYKEYRVHN
jgi:hypothetical protein